MFDVRIRHVGVFREPEAGTLRPDLAFLVFHVRGLMRVSFPGYDLSEPPPFLALTLPGERTSFSSGPDRENWVVLFESRDMRPSTSAAEVLLRHADQWVPVTRMAPVPETVVAGWQNEFARMRECFSGPTPANRLRAELGTAGAVRYMLDQQRRAEPGSPAAQLKRLLDDPANVRNTLQDLSRELAYSADHLRILFEREFHITPAEYRNRQRLAAANDLMAGSRLSLKEIAIRTGFCDQSRFSTVYKKAFGMTPRQALRQLRHG